MRRVLIVLRVLRMTLRVMRIMTLRFMLVSRAALRLGVHHMPDRAVDSTFAQCEEEGVKLSVLEALQSTPLHLLDKTRKDFVVMVVAGLQRPRDHRQGLCAVCLQVGGAQLIDGELEGRRGAETHFRERPDQRRQLLAEHAVQASPRELDVDALHRRPRNLRLRLHGPSEGPRDVGEGGGREGLEVVEGEQPLTHRKHHRLRSKRYCGS
mmetsp:Transcript_25072/g.50900  ORF Transcript_25072/g.50900 Transcript_25072/m.50900 type:complete len:209 (-) Transcript_25072:1011-1637(-)